MSSIKGLVSMLLGFVISGGTLILFERVVHCNHVVTKQISIQVGGIVIEKVEKYLGHLTIKGKKK